MTASTRAGLPPGTAIRETGNILVTLIEAERAAAAQKAEAGFMLLLEHQQQEADHCRARFESEAAVYRQRIQELEDQNFVLQAQLQGGTGHAQILNNPATVYCEASQGTMDPRNLMKTPSEKVPSATLPLEKFGVSFDRDTISFHGNWVNLWRELVATEYTTDDLLTGPMTPADLEHLLDTSIDNVRRNKEERDSFAQSIMGTFTQF